MINMYIKTTNEYLSVREFTLKLKRYDAFKIQKIPNQDNTFNFLPLKWNEEGSALYYLDSLSHLCIIDPDECIQLRSNLINMDTSLNAIYPHYRVKSDYV